MDFKFEKGDRIMLALTDGTSCEGDVKNFNQATQRLCLSNVQYPGNIEIDGYRNFMMDEIVEIKGVALCDFTHQPPGDKPKLEAEEIPVNQVHNKFLNSEYNKILDLQNLYRYIDSVSTDFYSALSTLKKSEIIGLHVEDTSKGRKSRASVIGVSTETNIFLFDLESIGDIIFEKGFREVLQSPSIVKVVHDCRLMSDCLHHRHLVSMTNVRDVEAEDIMTVYQDRGCIRKHSRTFPYLVENYLGIQSDIINRSNVEESWKKRPLSLENQRYLAVYVSYLIPLHRTIQDHYMQRLIDASKIYNEYIRDSDMLVFVTERSSYVLKDHLKNLVKKKNTCRGSNINSKFKSTDVL